MMNRWLQSFFPKGAGVASVPLVFLTMSLVGIVQMPAHFLMRAGFLTAGILVNEIVAVAGVTLFLIWIFKFDAGTLLNFKMPGWNSLVIVAVATVGAAIVIDYLTAASEHFFPLPDRVQQAFDRLMAAPTHGTFVWKMFVLCLVPAVCEEIFFRGYCQTSLAARWGKTTALIVTSLLFALLHGNPWYFHLYFLLGLLLGWIYIETGSLWGAIVAHFFNNLWTFANNVRGFALPLGRPFGAVDAALLVSGTVLLVCSLRILRDARRAPPPDSRSAL